MLKRMKDENGISTVVVAVSIVAIFGALVLSLDAGQLWTSRRSMVTATDTSALVGARMAVGNTTVGACPSAIQTAVVNRLHAQESAATLDSCTLTPSGTHAGRITVDARMPVSLRFGGVLNLGTQSAFSSSTALYGFPTGAEGLRPFGLCIDNPHVFEWLTLKKILADGDLTNDTAAQAAYDALRGVGLDHPVYAGAGVVHRIFFNKANASQCGGTSDGDGNWGWMDYSDGGNKNNDTRDWLTNGFDGQVNIHQPIPPCTPGLHDLSIGCINGVTGDKGNAMQTELNTLVTNQTKFFIPIFDAVGNGGNNATFTVRAFIGMILRGHLDTPSSSSYLDAEFIDVVTSGGCCADNGIPTGVLLTKICEVDHDSAGEAARCTFA